MKGRDMRRQGIRLPCFDTRPDTPGDAHISETEFVAFFLQARDYRFEGFVSLGLINGPSHFLSPSDQLRIFTCHAVVSGIAVRLLYILCRIYPGFVILPAYLTIQLTRLLSF